MLLPKKTKYRKVQRGRNRGKATSNNTIVFGEVALQMLECQYITNRQIESARRALTRHIKRGGKVWIRIFPDKVVTRIPAETRMGKGKGSPEFWVAPVKPGTICFEIAGVDTSLAKQALKLASYKIPGKTRIIEKNAL